ncbi:hypothetical protein D3C72_1923040 [compost metagenome]
MAATPWKRPFHQVCRRSRNGGALTASEMNTLVMARPKIQGPRRWAAPSAKRAITAI